MQPTNTISINILENILTTSAMIAKIVDEPVSGLLGKSLISAW